MLSTSILSVYILKYQNIVSGFGVSEWCLISAIFIFASSVALCPPTFLALIYGYFLGFSALPYIFAINMGAILLVYLVCQHIDFKWIKTYLKENEKAKNLMEKLKTQELKIIFFAKLSPILPFALINLIFAVSGAKLKNVIIGGFAGMIPRTLLAVYTGREAKQISYLIEHPNEGLLSKILILVLLLVSVWGVFFFYK